MTQIDIHPINPDRASRSVSRQQMRVVATYADGRQRDVTREAFVESGDTGGRQTGSELIPD